MIYRWRQAFVYFFFQPADSIRLDTFRMCLGAALLAYISFRWQYAGEWLTAEGFHVSSAHLPLHDWHVPLIPLAWLPVCGVLFFGSLVCFILGFYLNYVSWIVLLFFLYVSMADQLSFFSPNKIFIISLFILGCGSWGRSGRLRPLKQDPLGPRAIWPERILQITFIVHLFMAGWTKAVYGEWLQYPLVLWTQVQGTYRTEFAAFLLRVLPQKAWAGMQIGSLLFELFCPLLFMLKRLRWIGFLWGGLFQLMIALTMAHLVYFNILMICFFILFMEPRTLQTIKADLGRRTKVIGKIFDKRK